MYLAEISPTKLRGSVGTVYQLVITISIVFAQAMGFEQVLGTQKLWPYLFVIILIPAVLMMLALPFCPESPKHILIIRNDDAGAQKGSYMM